MRGEHHILTSQKTILLGSSPHARGARGSGRFSRLISGIIPACAGSTPAKVSTPPAHGDHPRMRGEHNFGDGEDDRVTGSSPHARGALGGHERLCVEVGIIPACAGSTPLSPCHGRLRRDHPRMRGEHASGHALCGSAVGSSPHARGARRADRVISSKLGIIPACAGSTRLFAACRHAPRDHPRMRGEHLSPRRLTWSI